MRKKIFIQFFLLFLSMETMFAQIRVTGYVSDESGEPVIGASVQIKGTGQGTVTDIDGNFFLNTPENATLVFSYVGMKTQELPVSTNMRVVFQSDTEELEEVVVTAMGIQKERKALGYAVQDLKSEELLKNKSANIINSLSGKIAGVNVTQSSGAAGAGAQIILRGGTSLERDNQPLFVVDGVIYDNSTIIGGNSAFDGALTTATSYGNRVMDINPEDIENMSVLKGPAAAALYGSRAAAGAIIITTKKGQAGNISVNVSTKLATNWVNRYPEQQDGFKRGFYNAQGVLDTYTTQSWGEPFGTNDTMYDNIENFFQKSTVFDNNLSVSGGNQFGSFYLSASRFDQQGIVPSTGYDKTTFRFNGEQKYGILTVGANVAYSLANTDKTLTSSGLWGSGGTGAMTSVYRWARSDDMTHYLNPDGTKYRMFEGMQDLADDIENPYWIINKNKLGDDTERVTGNLNANLKLFDWWNVSYRAGTDSYTTRNSTLIAPNGAIQLLWQNGMMSESDYRYNYWSSNLMSDMEKKWGDFDLGFLLGYFSEETKTTTNRRMGYDFVVSNFYSFENIVAANKKFAELHMKKRLYGFYGEFRAAYKNMLYLTVTGRNDWTSTLPTANRSYFYPSVGGSFVFSELLSGKDILSFGKIRASWARVGKDAAPYVTNTYLWPSREFLGGIIGTGNSWSRGNPYLKPENTDSYEVGLEMRFLKGRLGFDWAYYSNNSYNQILSPRLGQSTGYIFVSVNGGDITNEGMELSLNGTPVQTRDFKWDVTLNMAGNRGTVQNLLKGVEILYVTDVQVGNAKAASFNGGNFMAISGSKWSRTENGKIILDAKTGMPTSDNLTTYEIGNREPKMTGGLNNSLQYKSWNLSFLFDFRLGGDIYNGTDYFMTVNGMSKRTMERDQLTLSGVVQTGGTAEEPVYEDKTFTFEADKTYDIGGTQTSGRNIIQNYWGTYYPRESDNFMVNTNWLRLRSVSLSYDLSRKILSNINFLERLTATVTGTNLLLFTNYKGMDPETSAAGSGIAGSSSVGIDYNGVPSSAGISFGLNLTF
ncbi:MAG: SusC/RagA family TonB-linked outer membrane protein [Porphyromonadaceae bacterium]|nr:SusC/RagA family TonB-linked outer membrane protein [Porphyromonadaceae bacterium]